MCVHREREVSFQERPGELEREAYTRVLKGLIALSTAVFPEKVALAVTGQRLFGTLYCHIRCLPLYILSYKVFDTLYMLSCRVFGTLHIVV